MFLPILYLCSFALMDCDFASAPKGMVFRERPEVLYSSIAECQTRVRELEQNVNSEAFQRRLLQSMPLPWRVFGVCQEPVLDEMVHYIDVPTSWTP